MILYIIYINSTMMTLDKDFAGMVVSTLCLIHCIAGPIILALGFSGLELSFLLNEKIHIALIFPILLFALWSIPSSYSIHKNALPIILAIVGIVLLLMGVFIENLEELLTILASTFLIIAHFSNKKQREIN